MGLTADEEATVNGYLEKLSVLADKKYGVAEVRFSFCLHTSQLDVLFCGVFRRKKCYHFSTILIRRAGFVAGFLSPRPLMKLTHVLRDLYLSQHDRIGNQYQLSQTQT